MGTVWMGRDIAAAEVSASKLSYKKTLELWPRMEHGPQPLWGQSCPVFQKKQEQWLGEGSRALGWGWQWGWGASLWESFTQYLNLEFTMWQCLTLTSWQSSHLSLLNRYIPPHPAWVWLLQIIQSLQARKSYQKTKVGLNKIQLYSSNEEHLYSYARVTSLPTLERDATSFPDGWMKGK